MSAAVYAQLPETMAVHWDLHGNPNGWMPRAVGAAFGPVLIFFLGFMLRVVPRIDPRAENYARFADAYETIVASVLLLMLVLHGIILALAPRYHVSARTIVPARRGARLSRLRRAHRPGDGRRALRRHRQHDAARAAELVVRHPHAMDALE